MSGWLSWAVLLPITCDCKELKRGPRFRVIASSWLTTGIQYVLFLPLRDHNRRHRVEWCTPPPRFFPGQKPVRDAPTFFSNLLAMAAHLLVKRRPGQVKQRGSESTSSRRLVWRPSCDQWCFVSARPHVYTHTVQITPGYWELDHPRWPTTSVSRVMQT